MNEMLVVVPSRGRPENIKRFIAALHKTNAKVDLIVGVDDDDIKLPEYKELENQLNFKLVIGPREKFAKTVNRIMMSNFTKYKYLSWMGDDHVTITLGWDEAYRNELDRLNVGVVYGNDLVMGQEIATELAFTSNIVGVLGYAIPQGFIHLYVDNYFMELGRAIGKLSYLNDIVVQHMHPSAGTALEDLTYREANSPENWTNDKIRFEKYIKEELPLDVEKLREIL